MKVKMPSFRKPKYVLGAVLMAAAATLPSIMPSTVSAAMLEDRSIQMSSAKTSQTNVTYQFTFTTSAAMQSFIVDFCSESPIIGDDPCTAPGSLNVDSATVASAGSLTGWTVAAASTANSLRLSGPEEAAGVVNVSIGTITNPSAVGTFYARIYTYANNTFGGYTDHDTLGSVVDSGGVALSTSSDVSVSGTVQETLQFCVSGDETTSDDCATPTDPTLELGAGDPKVIDSNNVYTGSIYSQISTNAGSGAAIRLKSNNSCGGLSKDNGATCEIEAIGLTTGNLTDALSSAPTVGKFGMKVASVAKGSGTLTSQAPYATADYGFDADTDSPENVTTTYGDTVAQSTGVLDRVDTTYTFAVRAATTTPAGEYTAQFSLIATGTY